MSVPPNLAVSEWVKRLKGRSSRLMLEEFGELRKIYWRRHRWARGYFVASSGNVTHEIIAEYMEKQGQLAPEEGDQDFRVESFSRISFVL